MHRATFAVAVTRFLAQQLGKHAVNLRPFRQAMTVTAMRAGDVVILPQRLAHTYRDSFFPTVEVSQAWHSGGLIELVDMLLEMTDGEHLLVHRQPAGLLRSSAASPGIDGFR